MLFRDLDGLELFLGATSENLFNDAKLRNSPKVIDDRLQ